MRILSVALLVAVLAPVAQAQLPTVLHTETNAANGHTYHLLDVSNWTDAEAAAVALGGHLTTIDDGITWLKSMDYGPCSIPTTSANSGTPSTA